MTRRSIFERLALARYTTRKVGSTYAMKMLSRNNEHGNVILWLVLCVVVVGVAAGSYWAGHRYRGTGAATASTKSSSASSQNSSTSSGSTTPSAVSMSTACGKLSLSKGTSEGTAGTMYWHAVITNNGTYACTLTGYPAAFVRDGASVSVAAVSNALYTPAAVTLAPAGGKAHVVLGVPDAANFDPSTTTCTAAASSTLHAYLPGLVTPLSVAFGESTCPGFSVTAIQSGP